MKYYDKVIEDAFERSNDIIATECGSKWSNLNISSITTKLIQETGRFCENYASDLLINIDRMNEHIKEMDVLKTPEKAYVAFGIRQLGVDGNAYVALRIYEGGQHASYKVISDYYRKIFCVKISRRVNEFGLLETTVELKNIQSSIYYNKDYEDHLEDDVKEEN